MGTGSVPLVRCSKTMGAVLTLTRRRRTLCAHVRMYNRESVTPLRGDSELRQSGQCARREAHPSWIPSAGSHFGDARWATVEMVENVEMAKEHRRWPSFLFSADDIARSCESSESGSWLVVGRRRPETTDLGRRGSEGPGHHMRGDTGCDWLDMGRRRRATGNGT